MGHRVNNGKEQTMTKNLRSLIAAAALLGAPALATASEYPRLVDSGEAQTVEYGPGPRGNIVGGGATAVTFGGEGNMTITYLEETGVQRRTDGRVPVLVGAGEATMIVWLEGEGAGVSRLAGLFR
jgi:hypothetical protein